MEPSVGSLGHSYDNALAETIIGLHKTELAEPRGPWKSVHALEYAARRRIRGLIQHQTPSRPRRRQAARQSRGRLLDDAEVLGPGRVTLEKRDPGFPARFHAGGDLGAEP